ncbi:hypothetical protein CAI21_16180 [Alkalilimnicola ehrlichii]|uniref:PAS fold-4 domain-containing protein n=1 Tax=Alkalilimnicola ehrlichii TaxID=351052 RepID=A0A3E0WLT4_9GAMM|nr:PAS domain-containing protein [Alkalilimnicola ehrlichii]RFA26818.1 hypothetical protein CAI21_16180 [Alkalilimnicola ehrlichii]RFA33912.1 hypothetical protein CAL65_16305 [Alkalilimnicola ehrlichii]
MSDRVAIPDSHFRWLFESCPDAYLLLLPAAPFTIVGVNRAREAVTGVTRDAVLGQGVFEAFPDNPDDPTATGVTNLRASLERVVATNAPDTMACQRYDIPGREGAFEERYWSPVNVPVLSPQGELLYILHRVEDVTRFVRLSRPANPNASLRHRCRPRIRKWPSNY